MSAPSTTFEYVYPGHPVSLAVDIMRRYPSYAAATARDPQTGSLTPQALRNPAIPGAGGNLYAALDLLKYSLGGHTELALEAGQQYWLTSAAPFGDTVVNTGNEYAAQHLDEFMQRLAAWAEPAQR